MPRTLIVDANPLLSALLGGAALPILCDQLPVAAFGDDFYGSFLPDARRLIGVDRGAARRQLKR
jgi:hypothetical protein